MKHIQKWLAVLLTVIMLVQLVSGIIPTLAISSTAQLTDHSFHGEGLWLTEIYPNDTIRNTVAADCIPVATFSTEGDMMEFIEVISTHDADFKLNDVYEIYSNSHKLPITTMSGSSDITVTKGQPIVIWNARTDLVSTDGVTLYYWNAADFEAAEVLSTENASGSVEMSITESGEYRGDIVGIAAKDLADAVYVAAVYSDGTTTWTSGVLGYSIGSYCASQSAKGADIAALAEATAVYGYHAKQYFVV